MDTSIARIIDANMNRAREAVRVMEDYARLVLNDPAGCEALKRFRHDFGECARALPAQSLMAARDVTHDVGTAISTETEGYRQDAHAVFVAAAKRLPEALRTIEEFGKTLDASWAARIEQLRYRSYELEQRLALRSPRSARFAQVRLYVIVTESLCRRDWRQTTIEAIEGGAGCVQLREKGWEDGELLRRARDMAAVCREQGAMFIVNDRPDIAVLADADGVHLGQTDMTAKDARRVLGPDRLIGLSTHNEDQLRAAIAESPDYIAVGPMFDTATKPQSYVPGPALAARGVSESQTPIVAIGGITRENVTQVRKAGAKCICSCSAIIGDDDPCQAAREIRTSMDSAQ